MAVNLSKYKDDLLKNWQEVVDDKSPTNWVLFSYEGQSYDLKVISKGDGGIAEMAEDLNSCKIMYAFCRVKDPKTSLPKYVLVNWQGESAPAIRKGTCANHLGAIEKFFKGIHVTVNARTEDEVDEDFILEKVSKASGSVYNFNRSEPKDDPTPVGTVYKRVNPSKEIDAKARDNFWAREEEEEKRRQLQEQKCKEEERKRRDEELKQRELAANRAREQQVSARMKNIAEQRQAENKATSVANGAADQAKWMKQKQEDELDDEERRMRSEILRRQRSNEAQALIKQRNVDARAIFEQNSSAGQLSSRKNSSSNLSPLSPAAPIKVTAPKWPPVVEADPTPPVPVTAAFPVPATAATVDPPPAITTIADPVPEIAMAPAEQLLESHAAIIVPPAPEFADIPAESPMPSLDLEPPVVGYEQVDDSHPVEWLPLQNPDPQPSDVAAYDTAVDTNDAFVDLSHFGLRARALYDYQAGDEGEISFDPGDIITHIDQIDPGWWQGFVPDGTFGLFPANYVEIIED